MTPFLKPGAVIQEYEGLPSTTIVNPDANLKANAYYFGQTEWARESLKFVHSYPELRERWHAVSGKWDDKVVVDIGCGPGNLAKTLGSQARRIVRHEPHASARLPIHIVFVDSSGLSQPVLLALELIPTAIAVQ